MDVAEVIPSVQNYEWGKIGAASAVSQLWAGGLGLPQHEIPNKPFAELWMGTHPSAPSRMVMEDGSQRLLRDAIGEELPYLFKVLSVAKALSVQAHPDIPLARKLHLQQPQNYKDANHKPEMACAVTDFQCMVGFRPVQQIAEFLQSTPEMRFVAGESASAALVASVQADPAQQRAALRHVFTNVMTAAPATWEPALERLLQRLRTEASTESRLAVPFQRDIDVPSLVLRLSEQYPRDIGVFSPFLLNCVNLKVGEAVFLGPNEPHAYLDGDIIECMACSDNVVRAGLTPKHRDVDTLCSMLTYNAALPAVSTGQPLDAHSSLYVTPAEEFALIRGNVEAGARHTLAGTAAAAIVIVYEGAGRLQGLRRTLPLRRGTVFLVPASATVTLEATEKLLFFRCAANPPNTRPSL